LDSKIKVEEPTHSWR